MPLAFTSDKRGMVPAPGASWLFPCGLIHQHPRQADGLLLHLVDRESANPDLPFGFVSHIYLPDMPAGMKVWKPQDNCVDCKSFWKIRNVLHSLCISHRLFILRDRVGCAISGSDIYSKCLCNFLQSRILERKTAAFPP